MVSRTGKGLVDVRYTIRNGKIAESVSKRGKKGRGRVGNVLEEKLGGIGKELPIPPIDDFYKF